MDFRYTAVRSISWLPRRVRVRITGSSKSARRTLVPVWVGDGQARTALAASSQWEGVDMTDKMTILITGAGSGIGRAIAQVLARAGHCVYASMRLTTEHGGPRANEVRRFAESERVDLQVIDLDVLSEASCRAAVDQVVAEQDRLDVIVNNAGMLMVGITEAFAPEQLAQALTPTRSLGCASIARRSRPCAARAAACWSTSAARRPISSSHSWDPTSPARRRARRWRRSWASRARRTRHAPR